MRSGGVRSGIPFFWSHVELDVVYIYDIIYVYNYDFVIRIYIYICICNYIYIYTYTHIMKGIYMGGNILVMVVRNAICG